MLEISCFELLRLNDQKKWKFSEFLYSVQKKTEKGSEIPLTDIWVRFLHKTRSFILFKCFQIIDEADQALSEVLLSLSGGKQYRSNNLTHEDGTMVFLNLVCKTLYKWFTRLLFFKSSCKWSLSIAKLVKNDFCIKSYQLDR